MFKISKPNTPSKRHLIRLKLIHLRKKPLIKKNVTGLANSSGRANSGKITVRHIGGGHKKKYRNLDFFRNKTTSGIVCSLEYDPNRNAHVASVWDFKSKIFSYILAPMFLKVGDLIKSGVNIDIRNGYSVPIEAVPIGSYVYNISTVPSKKGVLVRSAGNYAIVIEKTKKNATLRLPSEKTKVVPSKCYVSIGIVSNDTFFLTKLGKAGNSRWTNKRPTVRGVAMNPVDHPHGGGEGKKSGKALTPWGKPTKPGKKK